MGRKYKLAFLVAVAAALVLVAVIFIQGSNIAVLDPKGWVASRQRDLIVTTTLLMLVVVIPVFILTFVIAWKYREGNKGAKYSPDWDHHPAIEALWWGIPFVIIAILSVVAWRSSHELDPFKPLSGDKKPVVIQVVALQWKWLFIYPEQDIASVNFVQFPASTPVSFQITADAPMNSFWIPQLGGQIYAMAGMNTKLHLIADQPGSYSGQSANISGAGFAGMKFIAKSSTPADFAEWIKTARASQETLSFSSYNELAEPSRDNPAAFYSSVQNGLFGMVMAKFMLPGHQSAQANNPAHQEDL